MIDKCGILRSRSGISAHTNYMFVPTHARLMTPFLRADTDSTPCARSHVNCVTSQYVYRQEKSSAAMAMIHWWEQESGVSGDWNPYDSSLCWWMPTVPKMLANFSIFNDMVYEGGLIGTASANLGRDRSSSMVERGTNASTIVACSSACTLDSCIRAPSCELPPLSSGLLFLAFFLAPVLALLPTSSRLIGLRAAKSA